MLSLSMPKNKTIKIIISLFIVFLICIGISFNPLFCLANTSLEKVTFQQNQKTETKNHFYFSLGNTYFLNNFFQVNKILANNHYNFYFRQRSLEKIFAPNGANDLKKIINSDFFYFDFGLEADFLFAPYHLFINLLFVNLQEGVQQSSLLGTTKIFSRQFNLSFLGEKINKDIIQKQKLEILFGYLEQDFLGEAPAISNRYYLSLKEKWLQIYKTSSYYSSSWSLYYQLDYFENLFFGKHHFDIQGNSFFTFNKTKISVNPLLNIIFFEQNLSQNTDKTTDKTTSLIFEWFLGGNINLHFPEKKITPFLIQIFLELKGESQSISLDQEHQEGKYLHSPNYLYNEKFYEFNFTTQSKTKIFQWQVTPYLRYYLNLRENIHQGYFITPVDINQAFLSGLETKWKLNLGKIIYLAGALDYIFTDEKKFFPEYSLENQLTINFKPLSSKITLSLETVYNLLLLTPLSSIDTLDDRLNTSSENLDISYEYTHQENIFFSIKILNALAKKNYLRETAKQRPNRIITINLHYTF